MDSCPDTPLEAMGSASVPDFGYFVDSDDECEIEAEAEPRQRYTKGLYYPVQIGEVLIDTYRIQHKLGWGGYSTVWLAHDLIRNKEVALKIMTVGEGQGEYDIQRRISNDVNNVSRLILCETSFWIPGAESNVHMVLVYPLLGPSPRDTIHNVSPTLRMSAAKHLLLAVHSLHEAGFVHKDLNLGNVLWHSDSIDGWTTEKIYRHFGRPRKAALPEAQGKPGELVEPMKFQEDALSQPVYVGDFGLSFKQGDSVQYTVQSPVSFCAPERLHGALPDFATDMFSFMTIFTSLYLGAAAIPGSGTLAVTFMVGMLGPFPKEWKDQWSAGDGMIVDWWYDHSGQAAKPKVPVNTLEHKIAWCRPDTTTEERELAMSVMRKGFCYVPDERITAAQLLEDPSFIALLSKYGL